MRFIPGLFNTAMVQSILEDRKTNTRRVINPQPKGKIYKEHLREIYSDTDWGTTYKCPYGQPGDIIWVRETWKMRRWDFEDGDYTVEYKDGSLKVCETRDGEYDWLIKNWEKHVAKGYLVPSEEDEERFEFTDKPLPWNPSIHMPKEACRIFLKVKSVRVERLQDIDRKGAAAEGIQSFWRQDGISVNGIPGLICPNPNQYWTKVEAFRKLWQSIYGAESWEANPWVWVVEFERTELTEDQMKEFLTN